jgi:hypothetical protein
MTIAKVSAIVTLTINILFGAAEITLRQNINSHDLVSCGYSAPTAVKHYAEQRTFVCTAERHAM